MPSTNPKLIFTIVIAIAAMAFVGVLSLCLSLFVHVYADQNITTAVLTLTSTLVGTLAALLTNTRTQGGDPTVRGEAPPPQQITTAPGQPLEIKGAEAPAPSLSTPKIGVGDAVFHRASGRRMIVADLGVDSTDGKTPNALCRWQENGEEKSDTFPLADLVHA